MTNVVCFHNSGSLDHRAFTMLGLSAKSDDKAIGFFGTGFKYAIATLLRNGCKVGVAAKNKSNNSYTEYSFYTKPEKFRNKQFDFIYCEDNIGNDAIELPYTTHLGTNWKMWQAYRELFTNARDEGGGVVLLTEDYVKTAGYHDDVCVMVTGLEFEKVHAQHDKYFINPDNHETIAASHRIRCVNLVPDSDNVVYYKTMYTGTRLDKQALFTYDYVTKVDLTEDRTLADVWYIKHHIHDLWVGEMGYDRLLEYLPKASHKEMYEHDLSGGYVEPSDDFISAVQYLLKHRRPMPLWAHELFLKSRPFDEQVTHHKLTKFQRSMLMKAVAILDFHDCPIDHTKIVVCVSLPEDLMGMVKNDTIYLAKQVFERGDMTIIGTLFEEWCHLHHRCEDMTRKMQNILIDRIALLMQQVYETEGVEAILAE